MWTDRRFGGKERLYMRPPKDAFMRVPNQVLKTAVFLGLDAANGTKEYGGTGYVVSVEYGPGYTFTVKDGDTTETQRFPFMFLLTAAHVAEKLEGVDFYIRANKKDGSLAEPKQLCESTQWWYHPTERESVDAAAMLLPFQDVQELDIEPIPATMFAGEETMQARNLGIGDEVFVAGLFSKAKGIKKNIPIIRVGNVAMIPGEKINFPTEGKKNQELYANLLESRSIGGLSGSPVFIRETVAGFQGLQGGRFYFFGSMIGHWHVIVGLSDVKQEAVNMGIAPMVPATKILEVLGQPRLRDFMNKISADLQEKKMQSEGVPVLDSGFRNAESQFTKDDFESALKKASRKLPPKKKSKQKR